MANSRTAQIRIRMGRGMFLFVFFFAIGTLLSLLFGVTLFMPAHAEQIQGVSRRSSDNARFFY